MRLFHKDVDNLEMVSNGEKGEKVVFYFNFQTSYTLRVLRVMQTVAQCSGSHQHYMFACTQLVDNLLMCSQPPLAEEVVGATEEWMRSSPGAKSALEQSALYVHFLLAKSHVLLQLNRVCQCDTIGIGISFI